MELSPMPSTARPMFDANRPTVALYHHAHRALRWVVTGYGAELASGLIESTGLGVENAAGRALTAIGSFSSQPDYSPMERGDLTVFMIGNVAATDLQTILKALKAVSVDA